MSREEIIDAILPLKFLVDLEENMQRWVHCHHLKMSRKALWLVEDFDCAQREMPCERADEAGTTLNTKPADWWGD